VKILEKFVKGTLLAKLVYIIMQTHWVSIWLHTETA